MSLSGMEASRYSITYPDGLLSVGERQDISTRPGLDSSTAVTGCKGGIEGAGLLSSA